MLGGKTGAMDSDATAGLLAVRTLDVPVGAIRVGAHAHGDGTLLTPLGKVATGKKV